MKILILTKNHPVQILDVVTRIYNTILDNRLDEGICISPQAIAMMVEEAKNVPYQVAYWPAVKTFEDEKEELSTKAKHFFVVGSVPVSSLSWYDAVIGIDDAPEIKDYTEFDDDFKTEDYVMTTLDNAEVMFEDFDNLRYFITKVLQQEK